MVLGVCLALQAACRREAVATVASNAAVNRSVMEPLQPEPLPSEFDRFDDVVSVRIMGHGPIFSLDSREQIRVVLEAFRRTGVGEPQFHMGYVPATVTVVRADKSTATYNVGGRHWEGASSYGVLRPTFERLMEVVDSMR